MKRSAFTLVELLVVIAIVGLLSSVAVVATSNSRDKAKVAAGQSFDQSLRHGLGDQLVGEWLMNECSGNTAADSSGSGSTATWSGGAGWSTSNAPGSSGCSAGFSGSNQLSSSLNLQSPNVTFSAWVYPTSVAGWNTVIGKELQYRLDIHDGKPRYVISCNGTNWIAQGEATGPLVPTNSWSMIALSVDSVNQNATLYLNGNAVNKGTTCNITAYNANPVTMGLVFYGRIDDVRTYTNAVSLSQIQKMYAEGLPAHQLATIAK